MPPAAAPTLHAQAPDLARRLGVILAALRAVVAMRFLRNPALVLFILPLCSRLNRTAQRFARLASLFAAGRLPAPRPARSGGRSKLLRLPAQHGWLFETLRHEAAPSAIQLEHLLAEPAMAEFLAASPTAVRLLRPICRMLALPPPGPTPEPAPELAPSTAPPPAQAAITPPPAAEPPRRHLVPPPCPRSRWPWFSRTAANPA